MKYSIHRDLHTDFSVFEQNKMPARSYFIPFSSYEKLGETDYKNERYKSDRVLMLSGGWDFAYFEKLSKIADEFDTDKMSFDTVAVPSTWQRTGYDQIAYINTRYPFPKKPPHIPADVAVGIYRKKVNFSDITTSRILTFLGVAGALAVYMNGEYLGYSEGSHNTAEFDITSFAKKGENEIIAVVYKWSNGTYLECQDMFRENGIFRDVYIISQGKSYVNDFLFRSTKNKDGSYDLHVEITGKFAETDVSVRAQDSEGNVLFETNKAETDIKNLSVNEWSAEIPNIYTVTISLEEAGGTAEVIRTYIGFKDVKINKEVFSFNGKAIKMKGVNHHDTHMTKGYAMSIDDMEQDIILMKEYNCNTVRTSHYPPDPTFLTMCDFYGLYVVDEADIETHGFYAIPHSTYNPNRLSNDIKWSSHYLDRVKRMYDRDKNHSSITMWSLGNESGGYKCQDVCYDFLNKANPEIPVHYEGVNRSKRWCYDVVSHMYARPALMRKVLEGKGGKKYDNKPFFQCEYAHAMGNGPGGLEEYMQLFYSSDQFMGGCIWEWVDHSVYDENGKYKWTYGGDHNEPIHDGNFCVDGLFFPDRTPSSGALEMKAVYRPLRATYRDGKIEFWNTQSFADTSNILVNYQITVNGDVTEHGMVEPVISSGEKKEFSLADKKLDYPNSDIFINLVYTEKSTGFEIAGEQLTVSLATLPQAKKHNTKCEMNGSAIHVTFKNGSALFEKKKGLVSYIKNGKELLLKNPIDGQNGFVPHIYRGRLDNDQYTVIFWNIIGLESAKPRIVSCKLKKDNDGNFVRTVYNFVTRGVVVLAHATVDYRFGNDGEMTVTAKLTKVFPLTAQLPRFGVHAELDPKLCNVEYYGRGPEESYSDFIEHAPVGKYKNTVEKMAHKYIKPQDAGNREDVRQGSLTDNKGRGINFRALGKMIRFNANPFTLQQLIKAKHIEDLPDCNVSFVTFDGYQRGTGSGSCGPAPADEHLIHFGYTKPLEFSFEIVAK